MTLQLDIDSARGSAAGSWTIGTDVGGTFTDLWLRSPDGKSYVCKSPTTQDVVTGVIDAVHLAADSVKMTPTELCSQVGRFGHGTTVGLNALLTGRTVKTGLITTRGFGDVLEIGRLRRGTAGLQGLELGDYFLRGQIPPLVPRHLVAEVDERIDRNGEVLQDLDLDSVREAVRNLIDQEVKAVSVCLLWATENPEHELQVAEIIAEELPEAFLSLSHQTAPAVGEYARASTTSANAALGPIAGNYLLRLEKELQELGMNAPIMMTTSAGGVAPAKTVTDSPVTSLLSGPASCVVAGQSLGAETRRPNILTMDVGGTSFDVGVVVEGSTLLRDDVTFGGADMKVPSVDIASVGAGGGSIAAVTGGVLTVGPRSAGANPGPVCYGKGGTQPTTTDADLVLGILDPESFSSGGIELDREAALQAIDEKIARPLGISAIEGARAIRVMFDATMSDLLRSVTIERGYDAREFVLVAGGGSGPSHAWALCRELGLDNFLVPATATAQSAYGAGTSELKTTAGRTAYVRIAPGAAPDAASAAELTKALELSRASVLEAMTLAGTPMVSYTAAVRYHGQTHHLDIPLATEPSTDDLQLMLDQFESSYEVLYGKGSGFREAGFEILSVRAVATLPSEAAPPASEGEQFMYEGAREVIFDDAEQPEDTEVYSVKWPAAGQSITGPALINLPGCVVVVPPGGSAFTEANGIIDVKVSQ